MYPAPLLQRFSATLKELQTRVGRLETRTAGIDSGFPLMVLLGVVNPAYTSGDPTVQVNGQVDSNGNPVYSGPFQHLASYTPVAGDSVLLVPVGALQAYVIIGHYL